MVPPLKKAVVKEGMKLKSTLLIFMMKLPSPQSPTHIRIKCFSFLFEDKW
jgi:hypothetical protein